MIRSKFTVQSVTPFHSTDGNQYGENVTLAPVYSSDPESENRAFWTATPSGRIDLYIQNLEAFGKFPLRAEFYVDFTKAEE